jgi:hypothetical protein
VIDLRGHRLTMGNPSDFVAGWRVDWQERMLFGDWHVTEGLVVETGVGCGELVAGGGVTLGGVRRTTWPAASGPVRYQACSTAGFEIYVLASAAGVTATVATVPSGLITFTIPAGVTLVSARIRWPGTWGTYFCLDMGTTDMGNTGFANRWGCTCVVYREDTGAMILTAATQLVPSVHDQIIVKGLHDTQVNSIVVNF